MYVYIILKFVRKINVERLDMLSRMHMFVRTFVCVHIHMYIHYVYVCMYVCLYMYTITTQFEKSPQ